jgi:hypothetical protein
MKAVHILVLFLHSTDKTNQIEFLKGQETNFASALSNIFRRPPNDHAVVSIDGGLPNGQNVPALKICVPGAVQVSGEIRSRSNKGFGAQEVVLILNSKTKNL